MNYFAHGMHSLHDAWELAGTALPDLVRSLERRVRISAAAAQRELRARASGPDPTSGRSLEALARGIQLHEECDRVFHTSPAFLQLCGRFTVTLRRAELPRSSTVAHVLVEMLLDEALVAREPDRLDDYYQRLHDLDLTDLGDSTRRIANHPLRGFEEHFSRFRTVRFLADYADDEKLLRWLETVMRRVRIELSTSALLEELGSLRNAVGTELEALLAPTLPLVRGLAR